MSDFSVAAVFSNHCVLQRDKIISIFGNAEDGSKITVELYAQNQTLLAKNTGKSKNGRWLVMLESQKAQNDCSLKITCNKNGSTSENITFNDVAIGEVWLAGGQSNMEFELQNCTEGPDELNPSKNPQNPNVRFYYTNKIAWMDEKFFEAERNTSWQTWDSEWKKSWSAVGYFFAKKLASDLGVTVGVIGCNWGGTSASAWMRREYLEKDEDLRTYLTEQEEATAGKSIEQQCREYEEYEVVQAEWQKKCDALYAANPDMTWNKAQEILGNSPWPGPHSCKNPFRPCGLYDCMLNRVLPYTLKGVIWYQGECDDHKPYSYAKLFSKLIDNWRTDWKDPELPFVFVQLPNHRNGYDKDFKHWCLVRAAQEKVHHMVKNAFMTCALDLGQFNDIHPKAKKVLAERMEQNALANVYNLKNVQDVLSPMLKNYTIKGADPANTNSFGKIILTFENATTGFVAREDKINLDYYKRMEQHQGNNVSPAFTGFEIAGDDGIFYPAAYRLGQQKEDFNTITLSSPLVKNPVSARYAWYNYGPVNIFGKNGLPLAPFMI